MENKIQYRRKDNTKGIRITENNIKGWVRDKRTGSRRYSNTIKIDKDMFQKMYVDLDVDYEDFDNIDEEEAVKVKAKNLPEGWYWVKYYDGSGNLQAPDGKEYMIYDLNSDEYLFSYESDIWNSIREGYEIPKKNLNPFEIMEKEMLDYHKDLLVIEGLDNGYEI